MSHILVKEARLSRRSGKIHLNWDIGWITQFWTRFCRTLTLGLTTWPKQKLTFGLISAFFEPKSFIASLLSLGPKIWSSWDFTHPCLDSLHTDALNRELTFIQWKSISVYLFRKIVWSRRIDGWSVLTSVWSVLRDGWPEHWPEMWIMESQALLLVPSSTFSHHCASTGTKLWHNCFRFKRC